MEPLEQRRHRRSVRGVAELFSVAFFPHRLERNFRRRVSLFDESIRMKGSTFFLVFGVLPLPFFVSRMKVSSCVRRPNGRRAINVDRQRLLGDVIEGGQMARASNEATKRRCAIGSFIVSTESATIDHESPSRSSFIKEAFFCDPFESYRRLRCPTTFQGETIA